MIRPRWRKVLADLWGNKVRTLLVVASIAVGVLALGVNVGTYMILARDLNASYESTHPANITLTTYPFDPGFVDVIERMEEVDKAEGRRTVTLRVASAPGQWEPLTLIAIPDFAQSSIHRRLPKEGNPIPNDQELVLEHLTLDALGVEIGDTLEIELEDNTRRTLTVAGAVLDQANVQELILGANRGFITYDTLEWLHAPESLDELLVTVSTDPNDKAAIRKVATSVTDRVEKSGRTVFQTRLALQNQHPFNNIIEALLLVLMIIGLLILFLSGSLIFNTMSALLSQHLRQIGVMKLVGARRRQVIMMYLLLISSFSLIALLFAVPAGAVGAYYLAGFAASILNFQMRPFYIVPQALIFQIAVGLLIPPVAGLLPVLKGARITVRKALSSKGLGADAEQGWLDRQLARWRTLARPLLISLRNTFRRKGRLALTLFTLTLGGAIFIAVFNTQASLDAITGQMKQYFGADVSVDLARPYRPHAVTQAILETPGVEAVEIWTATSGNLADDDDGPAESVAVMAPPADSPLIEPKMLAGRWLLPGDETAMVVNEVFWETYPELRPGDTLDIEIAGEEEAWTVVGIFQYTGVEDKIAYANYDFMANYLPGGQRASMFRVTTFEHTHRYQAKVAQALERTLDAQGYPIAEIQAGKDFTGSLSDVLGILTTVLLIMAITTALVGSIGLTGTMSMNVLERTREIGVMRAIGAHNRIVAKLVIVEGLIVGMLSYLIGALLSVPISYILSNVISQTIFSAKAEIAFTVKGFGIWLGVVVILSVLASLLPARNATRLTIREVLAYE
jgi:putative ABC transport system permease protein